MSALTERFMANVSPEPNTGCWLWLGSVADDGYGRMRVGGGRRVRAHRLALELFAASAPGDHLVCHRCDQPTCVNPAHLFVGTNADNLADMARKGRSTRGGRNPNARLSPLDVAAIRASTATNEAVARRFGISATHASRIRNNHAWEVTP